MATTAPLLETVMIDRFFTIGLAAGLLALAVSTVFGFGRGFEGIGPRLVQLERVMVHGKRVLASADTAATPISAERR